METTLNIDDNLLSKAGRLNGIKQKTALIHAGFQALICPRERQATGRAGWHAKVTPQGVQ